MGAPRVQGQGGGGAMCGTAQSALTGILESDALPLTVILESVMWYCDQHPVTILCTVNLQFQSWFVPISLRLVLRIMQDGAAHIMAISWSA